MLSLPPPQEFIKIRQVMLIMRRQCANLGPAKLQLGEKRLKPNLIDILNLICKAIYLDVYHCKYSQFER